MSKPQPTIHIDFETRSAADLKKVGAHRYAEDPTTEIICMSYRIGDGPVRRWRPGELWPMHGGRTLPIRTAHNAGFERAIWNNKAPTHERLHPEDQDCTMARGLALGLPAGLEQMGAALEAKIQKDKDGHRLMMRMCKPKSLEPLAWYETPEEIERLQAYCDQDVLSECAIDDLLPPLSDRERRVWILDQTINDRGVKIDVPTVQKALAAVEVALKRANEEMWRLTGGVVNKVTEVAKIVAWLNARGVPCKSLAKGDIDDLVDYAKLIDDETAQQVVRLRRAAARSSTAKFQAMLNTVCRDGRVRGSLAYHKAHTGRWAGSGMQPQNFPRVGDDEVSVDLTLRILNSGVSPFAAVDRIELVCGPPMEILSKSLRAMIVAPAGKKLVGGDFANIEGRVNAWLAGETWKLEAFRAYDAGAGPDLYKVMAAAALGKVPADVSKLERQGYGKVPELACGFQGAIGAFQKMAYTQSPPVLVADDKAKQIVAAWRTNNPAIVQSWWDLQDAALEAVGAPGCVVPCLSGRVAYVVDSGFLWCKLPSGRVIAYSSPRISRRARALLPDGTMVPVFSAVHEQKLLEEYGAAIEIKWANQVEYLGTNPKTKQWDWQQLYGGAQCNHIVQGTARDLLVDAMFRVEEADYPLVLTVHDELISEVDADFGSAADYERLMSILPRWAEGLPVATTAWEDTRYTK